MRHTFWYWKRKNPHCFGLIDCYGEHFNDDRDMIGISLVLFTRRQEIARHVPQGSFLLFLTFIVDLSLLRVIIGLTKVKWVVRGASWVFFWSNLYPKSANPPGCHQSTLPWVSQYFGTVSIVSKQCRRCSVRIHSSQMNESESPKGRMKVKKVVRGPSWVFFGSNLYPKGNIEPFSSSIDPRRDISFQTMSKTAFLALTEV